MNLAKKTVITNSAKNTLGITSQTVEDALIELHKNDNDNFKIGDVKLSGRTISDANWTVCDGRFLSPQMPLTSGVRSNLIANGSFAFNSITGTETYNQNFYVDGDYVIVASAYSPAASSSGTRYIKLYIYTIAADGTLTLAANKTIYSTGTTRYFVHIGGIVKFSNYYYLLYRVERENSSGDVISDEVFIAYASNPIDTWTSESLVSSPPTYLLGMYTNQAQSSIRIDFANVRTGSSSAVVTTYKFDAPFTNLTTSTQTSAPAFYTAAGWDTSTSYCTPRFDGNLGYFRPGPDGNLSYKTGFTSNWTVYNKPAWTTTAQVWEGLFYSNSVYWGIFRAGTSSSQTYTIVGATTISDLLNLSRTELPYNFTLTVKHPMEDVRVRRTESNLVKYYVDTSNYVCVLLISKKGLVTQRLFQLDSDPSGSSILGEQSSDSYLGGVINVYGTKKIYRTGLALPTINLNGIKGYIKIATN